MVVSFTDWNCGSYLEHHGVLGQKWGVRRYQNKDGSLTDAGRLRYRVDVDQMNRHVKKKGDRVPLSEAHTISKGTSVYRVTTSGSENEEGVTYVSYLQADRDYYRGNGYVKSGGGKDAKLFENVYVLNEDLNVPSRKEAMDVVNQVMKDNRSLVRKTVEAWADMAVPMNSMEWMEHLWAQDGSGKTEKQLRKAFVDDMLKTYSDMSPDQAAFFAMQSFGHNEAIRTKVGDALGKRGYNAMVDEASVGGQNGYGKEGIDPIIVFDRKKAMTKMTQNELSSNDENKSMRRYNKAMRKARQNRYGAWSDI